jgi:precorrin-6Y C5,15-methyltransferase (decarboxylating)
VSSAAAPWLSIVGIGEDGRAGLSAAALAAVVNADFVVGGARHLALAAPLNAETATWSNPIAETYRLILARRPQRVCVLATGDPFHFGVGAELAKLVSAEELTCFPQPSAFSLAAARLGWSLPDCTCVSLHGRAFERVIPHLQPDARMLALSWDGSTPARLAALLRERGFGASRVTVLEAMGGPREQIRHVTADGFGLNDIDPLNVVAITISAAPDARVVTLSPGLDDGWFENDGQLTKADVRAVTLAALAPRASALLWDVGAGAGSIAIEWMLRHAANRAIAIESRPDRAARIMRNAVNLGVPDLGVVNGKAPEALRDLPQPDAVFIGGGGSEDGVFDACWSALKPGGRLVVNAVTLETERAIFEWHARLSGSLKRIALSHLEPVGSMHGWRTAMPVTQWSVVKP